MPKISVIIPVYKAENSLRRCVESVIFGEERDLEVILVDDCSPDGSWELCQRLTEEYRQVRCLQNERNSGVSYTRNRGLEAATGRYVLFVDSDDWVSGSYAKTLIETLEANPGKLVVCGYTFIDHTTQTRMEYGINNTPVLMRQDFFELADAVILQQLWNKIFKLDDIRKANIRFNESISMGEDYQFVLDLIEALDYKECVIINQPLYYYVRWGSGSLMDNWVEYGSFDEAVNRVKRMGRICGSESSAAYRVEQLKHQYLSQIARDSMLSKQQKLEKIRETMGDGKEVWHYRSQEVLRLRERVGNAKRAAQQLGERLLGIIHSNQNTGRIRAARKALINYELTIISQNCIGGVFSHDMGQEFRSPTVNLFFPAADFIKFVNNLDYYLNAELELVWGEEYPVGKLADIELRFVHYETCQEAREAWERRKKRVDLSKIVVLSTDRDGFDETVFEQWKALPYPKLLFTAHREYASHPDALYFPHYAELGCVPDLIPKREFYKDDALIKKINAMGGSGG